MHIEPFSRLERSVTPHGLQDEIQTTLEAIQHLTPGYYSCLIRLQAHFSVCTRVNTHAYVCTPVHVYSVMQWTKHLFPLDIQMLKS